MALLDDAAAWLAQLTGCGQYCFKRLVNDAGDAWAAIGIAMMAVFVVAKLLALIPPTRFLVPFLLRIGLTLLVVWAVPAFLLLLAYILPIALIFFLAFFVLFGALLAIVAVYGAIRRRHAAK